MLCSSHNGTLLQHVDHYGIGLRSVVLGFSTVSLFRTIGEVARLCPPVVAVVEDMYVVALDVTDQTLQSGGTLMITAPQLARAFDLSVASMWRGEHSEITLIAWLGDFRADDGVQEPESKPDAVSLLGGGGLGIRWYTTPGAVIGCTTGAPRVCYRIPVETNLPAETSKPAAATLMSAEVIQATI